MDHAGALVGAVEVALEDRVKVAAVRAAGHRLEALRVAQVRLLTGRQRRVGRALDPGQRNRGLQQDAVLAEVQQVGAELLADPEAAVLGHHHALQVEVGTGQQALLRRVVHDRPRDVAVGVTQLDELVDGDATGALGALGGELGLPLRRHVVDAQHEVVRVGLGAEAVVGHREEVPAVALYDSREAGDDLARVGTLAAIAGARLGARVGALGKMVGAELGAGTQRGGGDLDGVGGLRGRDSRRRRGLGRGCGGRGHRRQGEQKGDGAEGSRRDAGGVGDTHASNSIVQRTSSG